MAKKGTIYIQSPKIWLEFDEALTVINETHSFANEVVSQTLENGSLLADHIIILQDELECQIFVSNSVLQESQDTYQALKTLRNQRQLCSVSTDHEIYSNMVIESVSAPHEAPNVNSMTFTVKFKKIDWTEQPGNVFGKAYFEEPLVPQLQSLSKEASSSAAYIEQKLKRIDQGIQSAKSGVFQNVDDIVLSAVTMNDYGQVNSLDNNRFPATAFLYDIMKKIAIRNNFTETEIEQFFSGKSSSKTSGKYSLQDIYDIISGNIRFVPSLNSEPLTFNIIAVGQVIQFELRYDNILKVWKGGIKDAVGQPILENITMIAGLNNIKGLRLKYHKLDENSNIIEEDLVLEGLYITEPRSSAVLKTKYLEIEDKTNVEDKPVYEKGVESCEYAFTEDEGLSPCSICYFVDTFSSILYEEYIRGEFLEEDNALEELKDYVII